MNNIYKSKNHSKYLLQFHIILVCKFRYKFLENGILDKFIKDNLIETAGDSGCKIHFIESDMDHIHMMIETDPTIKLSLLVNKLKQRSSYWVWKKYPNIMSKYYWGNKHFCWTRGYFISSIGNVSNNTLREYILNQGKE